jgi:hypothetical protein
LFQASNQRSTITIITSKEGYHFNGYTSLSWNFSNEHVKDFSKQSFIFTLKNPQNILPSKYPVIEREYAICFDSNYDPIFLNYDIYVYEQSD